MEKEGQDMGRKNEILKWEDGQKWKLYLQRHDILYMVVTKWTR
jgi:hypothetical protein